MGKLYDEIDVKLAGWIRRQRLFFVATAPSGGGHVNVSPKGPIGVADSCGYGVPLMEYVGERSRSTDCPRSPSRLAAWTSSSPTSSG